MPSLALALLAFELPFAAPPAEPLPIVGGEVAQACQYPSAVALTSFSSAYCTGTLIHPSVVLTAAHCIHPANGWGIPGEIVFGEDITEPQLSIGVTDCEMHPLYDHWAPSQSPEDAHDLAYCVLEQPVTSVTPTPPIMGCEVDQLTPGATVQIVGFGADLIVPSGDGFEVYGLGTKRFTTQVLEKIDDLDQLYLLGMDASACSGDSGGPAYLQLADGSWRVVSAAARIHPDAPAEPPWCLYGVVHTGVWNEMEWFEAATGIDLTPCHETDGTWAPGADCTEFPLDIQSPASWVDACAAHPLSGPGMSCADPGLETDSDSDTDGDTDTDTDTDTGTSTDGIGATTDDTTTTTTTTEPGTSSSTTGEPTTTSTTGAPDTTTLEPTTLEPTTLAPTSGAPVPGGTTTPEDTATSVPDEGTGSGSATAGQSVDSDGCGCRSTETRGAWLLLGLLGLARRRRRAR